MVTQLDYCQFLLSSPFNYTQTYFADHVAGLSHDKVNRMLQRLEVTPGDLWREVQSTFELSPTGYIVFDDTVLDKNHSSKIELVYKQYSGNEHRVIRGIGVVTCVYVNPDTEQFWAIDYRLYDPGSDGKSKLDHVKEMLTEAVEQKGLKFRTVLMDSWYGTQPLMKQIDELEKIYYTVVKKNRLVDETQGVEAYQKIEDMNWTETERITGKRVKLHGFPANHKVQLFRVTVLPDRTEFVVTNDLNANNSQDVKKQCGVRWRIEEFHREIKQLTGIERCQCRKKNSQKNHIGCAMLVWARLKQLAYQTGRSVYEIWKSQYDALVAHLFKYPVVQMTTA